MTRKQRQARTETYDLSNPRNVAAFEALLEADDGQDPAQSIPRGRRGQQVQKREKEKFFKLKADLSQPAPAKDRSSDSQQQLQQLLSMFQGSCDPSLVTDVLMASGGNVDAAANALLGMLGDVPPSSMSGAGQPSSSSGASSSSRSQPLATPSLPWQNLPNDVKHAILAHLPLRDLARAAHTSREFHERASRMRRQVQHLVMQPGLGYSVMVGMVKSHGAAGVVDLSKLEKHISRDNPEEMMPQVIAMHKQEAEANLFKAVLAVSEGAAAAGRDVSVKGLVLKGLVGATDRVLAEALQNLKGLRSLDLSQCPALSNKSLYALAKYKASEGVQQQQEVADGEEEEREDYGFGSSEEWEQWPDSEPSDAGDDDAENLAADDAAADDDATGLGEEYGQSSSGSSDPSGGESAGAAAAEGAALDASAAAGGVDPPAATAAEQPSSTTLASSSSNASATAAHTNPNPAIHDPVNTALTAAVINRLAAVQLQSQQQAAAAAASAAAAAANPVGFQELRLSGNKAWADDGLRQLLQGPVTKHSLAKLDISGCKGITSAGLIIPPLGVLRDLRGCRLNGLTQLVCHMPASHPMSTLDLSNCHYLRKVDLHLAQLQHLNLAACRTLYRLRMRCPSLKTLSLSQCGMLHDFHTDAWQVPALQNLNLFGCRRASGVMLQEVLLILPELRSINLNGCWAISRLHLTGNLSLESVDLTGCRNLVSFSSSSTALTELQAASCGRLYSLSLASSNLVILQLSNCSQLTEVTVPTGAGIGAGSSTSARGSGVAGGLAAAGHRSSGKATAGKGLSMNGCSALSQAAKASLMSAMASRY